MHEVGNHITLTTELRAGMFWTYKYLYEVKEIYSPGKHYFLVLIVKMGDPHETINWLKEKGKDENNWTYHHQYSRFKEIRTGKFQKFYEFTTLSSLLSLL